MPNGYVSNYSGRHFEYNLFKLEDSANPYWDCYVQLGRKTGETQYCEDDTIFDTEKECIEHLKTYIIETLRDEGHRGVKDKKIHLKEKKVWYV